ncbi:MAG: TRAP transporter substrate-binding protein [Clostridiales bacterium]|nr:TRAP transporter substrate-binding protein [Clostridiales bacterium]
MKKNLLVLLLIVALAMVGFVGCGGNDDPAPAPAPAPEAGDDAADAPEVELPSYTFNVGTMFIDPQANPNFNATGDALAAFKEMVEERSEGRITIQIHWASILGGMDDLFDMLRTDDLDISYCCGASAHDVRYGVFNMPGVVTNYDMADDLMGDKDGELFAVYQRISQENNVQCISGTIGTLRGVFNNVREIHVPADLEGLMLRAYNDNTVMTYWNGLCNTTILPMSELYTAMQLGTVDGFEHAADSCLSNGLEAVSKHYSVINWQWQVMPLFQMSKTLYDSLDAETVALLEECAQDAAWIYRDTLLAQQGDTLDALEAAGCAVYEPTAEEMAEWDAYGASLYPQFYEAYGQELVDEVVGISQAWKDANL